MTSLIDKLLEQPVEAVGTVESSPSAPAPIRPPLQLTAQVIIDGDIAQYVEGKFVKVPKEKFLNMNVNEALYDNFVIKHGGAFYCGGDRVWFALEGKERRWIHDLYVEIMTPHIEKYTTNEWLRSPVKLIIA